MWRGIGALLLMLLLLSSNVCAQTDTLLYPLKNVPLLSGNFGELRATHLHAEQFLLRRLSDGGKHCSLEMSEPCT